MPLAICLDHSSTRETGSSLPSRRISYNWPYGQYSMMMQ